MWFNRDTIIQTRRRCNMPKTATIHARIEPELKEEAITTDS